MKKNPTLFILLAILGSLFLFPSFYRNEWNAVDPAYYDEWQIRYDRLVIARLVESRQHGFLSNGGLLGLGDTTEWNFLSATHNHQVDTYIDNGKFTSYFIYKSNPGFQGMLYGTIDSLLDIPGEEMLTVFRGLTTAASAITFGIIFAFIATEFGLPAGLLLLLFSAFSIWTVLPAGSIFWNLWAFYLPFLAIMSLLANTSEKGDFREGLIYTVLFIATLARILLNGFDLMTTVLIMTTIPLVYYSISEKWKWKIFLSRFIKINIVLLAATVTGLMIMSVQIASTDRTITNVFSYIANRFGSHFAGNSEYYTASGIVATKVGAIELISKYLAMPAINFPLPGEDVQILYLHLVLLFLLATALYFGANRIRGLRPRKAVALITATWFSILAPLSWILIFRPHSIIHTHVNTMGWQMPFTLLGFTLCGYVIRDLFERNSV